MVIKSKVLTLNSNNQNQINYTTEKLNGVLDGFLISSPEYINITICFNDYDNVELLNIKNFSGDKYLPIRIEPNSPDLEKMNFYAVPFCLNNKLNINIECKYNTTVNIEIRMK